MNQRTVLIVGGSSGIGFALAEDLIAGGDSVVLTSRSKERAVAAASRLGDSATGIALELSEPALIRPQLSTLGQLDGLVLSAIERDFNSIADYNVERAVRLATLKIVGYSEVVHALIDRLPASAGTGVVLFGGRAKDAPYPGSMTVSTVNAAVDGLANALAFELAPIRVNAIHPGIVGDSPFWSEKPEAALAGYRARTPGGELATVEDVVGATRFLLFNRGVSAHSLNVDRGWRVS